MQLATNELKMEWDEIKRNRLEYNVMEWFAINWHKIRFDAYNANYVMGYHG